MKHVKVTKYVINANTMHFYVKRRRTHFCSLVERHKSVNVLRVDFDCCYYSNRACNHDFLY